MLNNHPEFGTLCAVCNDCCQPCYFYRKYTGSHYKIKFLWSEKSFYTVDFITQEHLETFLSLKLNPNYRDLVLILKAIRDGGKIVLAQSPFTDLKNEVHMTPAMLERDTELAK